MILFQEYLMTMIKNKATADFCRNRVDGKNLLLDSRLVHPVLLRSIPYACNQGVPVSNLPNSVPLISLCVALAPLTRQLKRRTRAEFDIAVLLLRDVAINTEPFRRQILS